ncbi:MAG: ChbG/HpnK family deacetylase [Nitrospina sp.]|jgi:chitin disaccharide deacetylase|nr:ChbG/HpnK family deacetylase [Nitrospina sp.]MBT5633534.1 ChbG/HpnK family deacetylase [Nitrospina sp.]
MPPVKKVILCADDFGISPAVSKSICSLAEKMRVSATSVMVVYGDWNLHCRALIDFHDNLDIGLHFVLTDAPPVSSRNNISSIVGSGGCFYNMKQFMKRACLGQIKNMDILKELTSQYDKFVGTFGFHPDFIDGHHNVHQYPIVDNVVIEFVKSLNPEHKLYLRNTAHSMGAMCVQGSDFLKTGMISFLGSSFKKKLLENGIPTNESFGGVYNLDHYNKFGVKVIKFLKSAGVKNGIVMSHPGTQDTHLSARDPFCKGREIEESVLLKNTFSETLKRLNISLDKFEWTIQS